MNGDRFEVKGEDIATTVNGSPVGKYPLNSWFSTSVTYTYVAPSTGNPVAGSSAQRKFKRTRVARIIKETLKLHSTVKITDITQEDGSLYLQVVGPEGEKLNVLIAVYEGKDE